MKVALYARVATQDSDEREGIVLQIETLRAHATKQRHEVAEDYVCCDAGYSGASVDRPGLVQLRHGVQAKAFDAVLILSPDRLSRNCADFIHILEEFKRSAMHIMFVEQGLKMPLLSRALQRLADVFPPKLDPRPPPQGDRA